MNKSDKETLSSKQKKILRRLLAELRIHKRFNGLTFEEIEQLQSEERDFFDFHQEEYEEVMLKVIRAGLHIHPCVKHPIQKVIIGFIRAHRRFGHCKFLAKARLSSKRLGLETGVKPPYSGEQLEILEKILSLLEKGESWETIRSALTEAGFSIPKTRWGLRKKMMALFPFINWENPD